MKVHIVIKHDRHDEDGLNASGKIELIEYKADTMDKARKIIDEVAEGISDNCDESYTGHILIAWWSSHSGNDHILVESSKN